MATKQTKPKEVKKVPVKAVQKKAAKKDVVRPNVTHQPPAGASQEDITPRVEKEPKETFEQRTTGNNQPWLNADGTQNNG